MRGRLFSPKQHQHQLRGRRKAALLGGISRDTLITLGLFLLSLILFALPNVLLRTNEDDLSQSRNGNVLSEQQEQQMSLAPQHERDSEGRTRPTTTTTPRRASSSSGSGKKSGSSSSSSSGSSSSSSSSNNSEQRASDGGIYRRMYNITEPDVDETIKGTILDVKVTLTRSRE